MRLIVLLKLKKELYIAGIKKHNQML